MNEEELASLLDSLEQGLIRDGFSSLVNQERISAVEGKVEELTAQDEAQLRLEWSRHSMGRAPRRRADDVRVRPLTVSERLAELLDLLEAAVGGTYAIEMHLRNDIKAVLDDDENAWSGQVVFADPPESELSLTTPRQWSLPDEAALQQREAAVREVILRINQLRQQAEVTRNERLHSVKRPEGGTDADFDVSGDWS